MNSGPMSALSWSDLVPGVALPLTRCLSEKGESRWVVPEPGRTGGYARYRWSDRIRAFVELESDAVSRRVGTRLIDRDGIVRAHEGRALTYSTWVSGDALHFVCGRAWWQRFPGRAATGSPIADGQGRIRTLVPRGDNGIAISSDGGRFVFLGTSERVNADGAGARAPSLSRDRLIRKDLETGEEREIYDTTGNPALRGGGFYSVMYPAPDGRSVAFLGASITELVVWNETAGTTTFQTKPGMYWVSFSPSGSKGVVLRYDWTYDVLDLDRGTLEPLAHPLWEAGRAGHWWVYPHRGQLLWQDDDTLLYVAGREADEIRRLRLPDGKTERVFP